MVSTRRGTYRPVQGPVAKRRRKVKNPIIRVESMRGAVKALAENGWIGARELGTLERTSKNASAAVCNQDVWEALCLRVWPNTEKLAEEIDKMGGYRAWYRLRTTTTTAVVRKGVTRGKEEPLPPPTIKASDLSFLFEVKMAGKAIISSRISGKSLRIGQKESYLEKGGGIIRSGKSFESFGWVLGETKQILDADNFRTEPFTVEVQMLTPERLCPMEPRTYTFNRRCVKSAVDDSYKFIYPAGVTKAERLQELHIRPSIIGSNVERRLKKGLAFRAFPVAYLVDDGKRVVVGGLCAQVLVRNHVSSDWDLLKQEVKNTAGVSLLHIFEHLEGTSLTPSGLPKVTGGRLSYMPDKVLTLMFQYVAQRPHELLSIERVCKSMRRLLLNDEIWAAIPFTKAHNCDQIYRLNHLTIREKYFYAEGVRAIRYHQEQTDNIMLSVLGGGADGFRSLCQTLLNKLRRDSTDLPRVHVRGDTVGYLAEMLQQWMVTKLESARVHRFKNSDTPASYMYPVVITKLDLLDMDVERLNCRVPDGYHVCNCNMISDDWKWPVDHCSGDDVMKSNDRRKIIRRLAFRASVVNMTAETFDVLSTELLHLMGCLLADAYSISKHSIAYVPRKSYRGEIDMFNCAPPCTEPESSFSITIVPGQIRKAAERRGIATFHVYGDTWIASSGSTVDQEKAEAEALYFLDDDDGISEPGKAGDALEEAPSDVGKEDSSNVACIDAEDKTMDGAAEEDTNGYAPVPSDNESSDCELDMQDFVDEWSSDYEP